MSTRVSTLPKPSHERHPAPPRRTVALSQQRRIAKAGMTASLGVLVWSALAGRRLLRRYHVLAGVALLGFTAWHLSLYRARDEQDRGLPR